MSNSLAINAVLPGLDRLYPLLGTKEGFPLNKQVPKTIQSYAGAGGVSIQPDGSDFLFISGTMAGALDIDLSDETNFNNMIGRSLVICCTDDHVGAITISLGTGVFISPTAATTGSTATIATTVATMCEIYFMAPGFAAISHGSAVTLA